MYTDKKKENKITLKIVGLIKNLSSNIQITKLQSSTEWSIAKIKFSCNLISFMWLSEFVVLSRI